MRRVCFDTHVAPLGLWGCGDSTLLYTYRPAGALVYGNSGFLYTLRSSGARELDTSAFYRHIAPLERKHTYHLLSRWVGQDARPTGVQDTYHFTAFFASLNFSLANALHSFNFWFRKSGICHFARDSSSASASVIGT